jgi:cell division septum initiation protein DivIVA
MSLLFETSTNNNTDVKYDKLIDVLITSINELKEENKLIKQKINSLEIELYYLKNNG